MGMIILFSLVSFPELIGCLLANFSSKSILLLIKSRGLWTVTLMRQIIILFILLVIAILFSSIGSPTTTLYAQKFGADTNVATAGVPFMCQKYTVNI